MATQQSFATGGGLLLRQLLGILTHHNGKEQTNEHG
jgi:hypothetical protein